MNLQEIRIKFGELSGRLDLVNPDGSDNGADFYINEGSRWLDRSVKVNKEEAEYLAVLSPGDWYLQFPMARAVKRVFIAGSAEHSRRQELEKISLVDILTHYLNKPPAQWIQGSPRHYACTSGRYIPEDTTTNTSLQAFISYIGVLPISTTDINTIILSNPVSESVLLEVVGMFYSMRLVNNTDSNFWSINHPLTLIQAAIRHTYVMSGNAAMLKIIDSGMEKDLVTIQEDLVEQEIADVNQMRG